MAPDRHRGRCAGSGRVLRSGPQAVTPARTPRRRTGRRGGGPTPRESPSLRRILIDLIEEYARHVGHADLIRESVDGLTGEDPPGRERLAVGRTT
ncbi:DUF664 domain-containing protein [Streptomyces sp. PKU-EA00015]|uniref:mycothiol transferase n=1 Tax=Streptomyces sp. PKU-EA00015 TaxID=2748326 RepID=UPI0028123DBC|nr:DUF664 domain-containing protein [Streptomyces sp. PKU-EA00015]